MIIPAPLEGTSQEHRVGAAIFRQVRYVFQLLQMMRFKDPILIRILHAMRPVGGQPLSDSDWQALLATELDDDTPSAEKPDVTGWYHTCYVWSVSLWLLSSRCGNQRAELRRRSSTYSQWTCLGTF